MCPGRLFSLPFSLSSGVLCLSGSPLCLGLLFGILLGSGPGLSLSLLLQSLGLGNTSGILFGSSLCGSLLPGQFLCPFLSCLSFRLTLGLRLCLGLRTGYLATV